MLTLGPFYIKDFFDPRLKPNLQTICYTTYERERHPWIDGHGGFFGVNKFKYCDVFSLSCEELKAYFKFHDSEDEILVSHLIRQEGEEPFESQEIEGAEENLERIQKAIDEKLAEHRKNISHLLIADLNNPGTDLYKAVTELEEKTYQLGAFFKFGHHDSYDAAPFLYSMLLPGNCPWSKQRIMNFLANHDGGDYFILEYLENVKSMLKLLEEFVLKAVGSAKEAQESPEYTGYPVIDDAYAKFTDYLVWLEQNPEDNLANIIDDGYREEVCGNSYISKRKMEAVRLKTQASDKIEDGDLQKAKELLRKARIIYLEIQDGCDKDLAEKLKSVEEQLAQIKAAKAV